MGHERQLIPINLFNLGQFQNLSTETKGLMALA